MKINVKTGYLNFIKDDENVEEYEIATLKLENDEYSDVIETDDGFYIIKMTNNNSKQSYDEAVSDAITAEKNRMLKKYYEKIKKNYKITINEDVWDCIVLGTITV